MKICVFGAGAVGGQIAARLASAEVAEVSIVARGANLAAVREHGLTLRRGERQFTTKLHAATDDPSELPQQDLVVVTLKAPALPAAATSISRLLKHDGNALFVTNGIPWWWHHGRPGPESSLPLLDSAGSLWELLRRQALGCVCYAASEVVSPGVVKASDSDRWIVGDPESSSSERLDRVRELFKLAGFEITASADLRRDVLSKLLVNVALNPISALTRLGTYDLCVDPSLRGVMLSVMHETLAVSKACGYDLSGQVDLEQAIDPQARARTHRASMLQDALQGRAMEAEAILGQVADFGRQHDVPTPSIDVVLALLRGLDRSFRS